MNDLPKEHFEEEVSDMTYMEVWENLERNAPHSFDAVMAEARELLADWLFWHQDDDNE